jgi:hypothetical protein
MWERDELAIGGEALYISFVYNEWLKNSLIGARRRLGAFW